MNKKLIFMSLTILITGLFTTLNAQDTSEDSNPSTFKYPVFQLLLSGGLGYAHNPDMDKWVKESADSLSDYYNSLPVSDGWKTNTDTGCLTGAFDAELRFFIDKIGFSAGTGYQFCEAKGESKRSGWVDKGSFILTLNVIPVIGTIYYRADINYFSFFLLGAGAGYYIATMDVEYKDEDTIDTTTGYSYSGFSTSAIGYHVKAEYDIIFGNFFMSVGVLARYVQFDKFEKDGMRIVLNGKDIKAGLTGANVYIAAGIAL